MILRSLCAISRFQNRRTKWKKQVTVVKAKVLLRLVQKSPHNGPFQRLHFSPFLWGLAAFHTTQHKSDKLLDMLTLIHTLSPSLQHGVTSWGVNKKESGQLHQVTARLKLAHRAGLLAPPYLPPLPFPPVLPSIMHNVHIPLPGHHFIWGPPNLLSMACYLPLLARCVCLKYTLKYETWIAKEMYTVMDNFIQPLRFDWVEICHPLLSRGLLLPKAPSKVTVPRPFYSLCLP